MKNVNPVPVLGKSVPAPGRARALPLVILSVLACAETAAGGDVTCVAPSADLLSWWDADSVSGKTAYDVVGPNDGTMHNGVGIVPGKVGQAFQFDGSDDFISIPDSPSFDLTSFTLEAWIKTADAGFQRRRVISQQEGTSYWILGFYQNQLGDMYLEFGSSLDGILSAAGPPLNDDQWHHVAVVRNAGSAAYWYIDGAVIRTWTISNTDAYNMSTNVHIGSWWGVWEHFNGLVDEVSVYHGALSASEIEAIYLAGAAGKCKSPSCPGDIDGDGTVGVNDFLTLLAAWGPNPGHPADLDGDGVVGVDDFLELLANWGPCP